MPYRPKLDPKVDLKGATPEKLARALFRPIEPLPGGVGESVAGDQVTVEKPPADKAGNRVTHLNKRV